MLQHLDLFSGIGGFALACQWAGIETIGFVEIDKYCQKVLKKHWPAVPIVEDIRDVERIKEIVANTQDNGWSRKGGTWSRGYGLTHGDYSAVASAGVITGTGADTARIARNTRDSAAILVTGGFPCQPFSVAGKRSGEADDRYLWPETLTVIEAIKPKWILLENVTGIKSVYKSDVFSELEGREYSTEEEATLDFNKMYERIQEREADNILWVVLGGLRGAGYAVEVLVIPACAVNAPHRRDRVWIVANSTWGRKESWPTGWAFNKPSQDMAFPQSREPGEPPKQERGEDSGRGSQEITMANSTDREPQRSSSQRYVGRLEDEILRGCRNPDYWAVEPELGRVAHGVPNRMDRLKCLGNAIVPQVAYEIIKAIVEIDERIPHLDYSVTQK